MTCFSAAFGADRIAHCRDVSSVAGSMEAPVVEAGGTGPADLTDTNPFAGGTYEALGAEPAATGSA